MENKLITHKVLPMFFMTLVVSLIGMIIGKMYVPPAAATGVGIIVLVILIVMAFMKGKRGTFGFNISKSGLFILTFLLGLSIYPVIAHYMSTVGAEIVLVAFGITVAVFGSLFLYAYHTKRDFRFLGGILFVALIALILVSLVGLFIQSEALHLVLAWVGVVIFSGYVLYDVSLMKKQLVDEKDVPAAVFNLYLDFINLFLDILRIVASFFSND